jgi:hypothetical protein
VSNLPIPPDRYDRGYMARLLMELNRRDVNTRKGNADVEIAGSQRLILSSPDGTRWSITVSNAGAISATSI